MNVLPQLTEEDKKYLTTSVGTSSFQKLFTIIYNRSLEDLALAVKTGAANTIVQSLAKMDVVKDMEGLIKQYAPLQE